jgi:hypothetical protein
LPVPSESRHTTKHLITSAAKTAGKLAKRRKPKLTTDCATAIQQAVAAMLGAL